MIGVKRSIEYKIRCLLAQFSIVAAKKNGRKFKTTEQTRNEEGLRIED